MGFNFPASPSVGQTYTPGTGLPVYRWDGEKWACLVAIGAVASAHISDTPPAAPTSGKLWWESDTGLLYIWYDDGSSQQWVLVGNFPALTGVVRYDTTQALTDTQKVQSRLNIGSEQLLPAGLCKLVMETTTLLRLIPWDGAHIRIAGVNYPLPVNGPTLAHAGASWGDGNNRYVYAYWDGSAVQLEASTTGHTKSILAGNFGVEIKNGDYTRTLVGMFRAGSTQFFDQNDTRWVRSWFNDTGVTVMGTSNAAPTYGTNTPFEVDQAVRCYALLWANEKYRQVIACTGTNNAAGGVQYLYCGLSTGYIGTPTFCYSSANGYYQTITNTYAAVVGADAALIFTMYMQVGSGTSTFSYKNQTIDTRRS